MNIYFKNIRISTGYIECFITGFTDKEAALKWIESQKKNNTYYDVKYDYVPNSCIKRLFGNDNFFDTKPWPK
jgi:hypothetical protein